MFSRFGPGARRVWRVAEQECRNLNHYYVGVDHLLLALLEECDDDVLGRCGIDRGRGADLRRRIRSALGTGDDRRLWVGILVTPRLRRVLALADADAAGDAEVAPEHLLRAISAEGGPAAGLLSSVGVRNAVPIAEVG